MTTRVWLTSAVLVLPLVVVLAWSVLWKPSPQVPGVGPSADHRHRSTDEARLRAVCSHCHRFSEPDTLPRPAWREIVTEMAGLPGYGANVKSRPSPAAIAEWYERRAPAEYTFPETAAGIEPGPLVAEVRRLSPGADLPHPFVSHLSFMDLLDESGLELLVCEMRHGRVLLGQPADGSSDLQVLAEIPHPAHAEPVDLDGDGLRDIVVANLGSFLPLDHNLGSVEWLRQTTPGVFERTTLFEGLGRVADVQPADIDGDGDLDLVVGEFGWRATGHVLILENATTDWSRPEFLARYIDSRSGAIHVPVVDLDGDGRVDIVALLAQEHEAVVAYLNRGDGRFDLRELHRAPHAAWGSSGMQLVDLDQDGDKDVLVTNGDTLDDGRVKPYHGLQWLENLGELRFEPHPLAIMYGVHRAEAADLDGDGDRDIVACAFTAWEPGKTPPVGSATIELVGLAWFEQIEPGRFRRWNLESGPCLYPTLAAADFDGDADIDFAVGSGMPVGSPAAGWVQVWENSGAK